MLNITEEDVGKLTHKIVNLETSLKAIELKLVKRFEEIRQDLLLMTHKINENNNNSAT